MLPPSVPRLRTCGSPIEAAHSAIAGHALRRSADDATSWWTVPAPISIFPSFSRMPERPGMRAMSINALGSLSRSFISGTRLWPPAMNFPAPLLARSFASASSSDVARLYSKGEEITTVLPGPSSVEGPGPRPVEGLERSEEHTSELQSHHDLVCRLLL